MERTNAQPRVTIGMPVYNGAGSVREAVECLLRQDFDDFELVISDNASTDSTAEICRELAAKDPRIVYSRLDENAGAVVNFARVVELARGELFAWAAHDDMRDPRWLSACVRMMDRHPHAVTAQTRVNFVAPDGSILATHANSIPNESTRSQRCHALLSNPWWGIVIYGLHRTEVLRRTPLIRTQFGGDYLLTFELSMLGDIVEAPEVLWTYRVVPFDDEYRARLARYRLFNQTLLGRVPNLHYFVTFLAIASSYEMPVSERARIYATITKFFSVHLALIPAARAASVAIIGDARYEQMLKHLRRQAGYQKLWTRVTDRPIRKADDAGQAPSSRPKPPGFRDDSSSNRVR